jgi:hypothetical protein
MKIRTLAGITCAAMLGLAPTQAQAQFTTYTTLASYLAAISGPATDTFNDLALGDLGTGQLDRTVGAYSYRAATPLFNNVGTAPDVWLSTNFLEDPITLTNFSANVRGVGGYFFSTADLGAVNNPSSVQVRYTNGGGTFTTTLTNPSATSFFGVVSNSAITSLEVTDLSTSGNIRGFTTINDLRLGGGLSVVPEPTTYALVAAGLAAMGLASRRRRVS